MTKKILFFLFNSLLLTAVFVCLTFIKVDNISSIIKVILLIGTNIIYFLSIVFKWFKMQKTSKILFVLYITLSLSIIGYTILSKYNIISTISSV